MSYSGNKKIILHIGITKTGSTALQKFLVDNKELLSEQGVGYYNSSVISSTFQPYKNAEALKFKSMLLCGEGRWADEKLVEEDLSKLKEWSKDYETIILSDEVLYSLPEGMRCLRPFLNEMFSGADIVPVVYFRRQDDWLESAWKEDKKSRTNVNNLSIHSYKKRFDEFLHYGKRMQFLEKSYGRDNFLVRKYDKNLIKKCICRDFIESIGLEWDDRFVVPENLTNTSLSNAASEGVWLLTNIFRRINSMAPIILKLFKSDITVCELYEEALSFSEKHPDPKGERLLNIEERRTLLKEFEEDNRYIARTYFGEDKLFDEPENRGGTARKSKARILYAAAWILASKCRSFKKQSK